MEVKDLMIGDLVLYTEFGKNEFHRIEIVEPTRVWLNGCNTYIPDEFIEPIPITPEILEKNGFEKVLNLLVLLNKWENGAYPSMIFVEYNPTNYCLFINDMMLPKPVQYLHELQHVLQLCGIEKDFVL